MNRRDFAGCVRLGLALPLFASSARADERKKTESEAKWAPRSAVSVDEIVSHLEARYGQATTFRADFKRHILGMPYGTRRGMTGTVTFVLPSKMSWRYTSTGDRVVSDATWVKVYERGNKRLYELELAKTLYPAALSFLIAQGKLRQNFKFTRPGPKYKSSDGMHLLIAEPLLVSGVYDRLLFYIDAQSYQMQSVLIRDLQGNRTRFDFIAGKVNGSVPESEFSFTPPFGTQLIRL